MGRAAGRQVGEDAGRMWLRKAVIEGATLLIRPQKSGCSLAYDGSGMTDQLQGSLALPVTLKDRLSAEDDPALWEQVLKILAEDASALKAVADGSRLFAEVGACSHWLRPHQTRWTAAGGFAWPSGYGGAGFSRTGLPLFDWSVILQFNPAPMGWVIPEQSPTRHSMSVRVAVPSRTTRHLQAAVHTLWSRRTFYAKRERRVLYGLRNLNGVWELKASTRDRERIDPV